MFSELLNDLGIIVKQESDFGFPGPWVTLFTRNVWASDLMKVFLVATLNNKKISVKLF